MAFLFFNFTLDSSDCVSSFATADNDITSRIEGDYLNLDIMSDIGTSDF